MLGDFNAKIGLQEPTPVVGLPKRKGYTTTCLAGRSLLQAMTNQGWTVASNRLCLDVHPTRFMATSKHNVQQSIIDHILCKPADWPLVKDERTHPCSGAEIARSDHNMISIDLHLAPSDPLPAPHAGPFSVHDTYEYTPRDTFRAHVLADNGHDSHSARLARDAHKSPDALPQELYQDALREPLDLLKADILRTLGELEPGKGEGRSAPNRLSQKAIDQLYERLVGAVSEALASTVGKYSPPRRHSAGKKPKLPVTLRELDKNRKIAQQALAKAIQEDSQEIHTLTIAMHTAAKEFARAMNKYEHEKQEDQFANLVLNSSTPRAAWQKLTKLLRPAGLGLPILVRDVAGNLLQSAAESTRMWHFFRAQVGADKSDSGVFDAQAMASLREDERQMEKAPPPTEAQDPILFAMNNTPIQETEVWAALKACPNGSAAGLPGPTPLRGLQVWWKPTC
jgi:hypothetical protein